MSMQWKPIWRPGIDQLYAALLGRNVDALLANAGRGLGKGYLDQDFEDARRMLDTNITGTIYLIQRVTCGLVGEERF
jgi:NADP-dependent 3-hydroxy acid dehydrogenase YdfG